MRNPKDEKKPDSREGLPFEARQSSDGGYILLFKAPLTYGNAAETWEGLTAFFRENHPNLTVIDLKEVDRIDSSGIALLRSLRRTAERLHLSVRFESVPPSAKHFLSYIEETGPPPPEKPPAPPISIISRLGMMVIWAWGETTRFYRFSVDFVVILANCIFRGRRFRWDETLYYFQLTGANAMSIVFMLSFLLGLVMAFQAAVQLRQFGANIYVADLLSLALTRELSPVFTAIILAGRSGSAFAAEIGTMKVGEELDALEVMGFDLAEYITLPKVFALLVAGPLLTMWSSFAGIAGGVVVGIAFLDLTVYGFMAEVFTVLAFTDVFSGLVKSLFFAILIGLIGCFRGFETGKAADSVGRQTTSAVVSGIFLIILADAIFTVIFNRLGW